MPAKCSRNFSLIALLTPLLASWAVAQQGMGGRMGMGKGMAKYDTATEATLKGTVVAVNQIAGPRGGPGGTHLTLKTGQETLDVHLGPVAFLQKEGIEIAKGDQVEVTGSRVKSQGGEAVLAREVKKGGKTFTLRNAQGVPKWSMGRRKMQSSAQP